MTVLIRVDVAETFFVPHVHFQVSGFGTVLFPRKANSRGRKYRTKTF